MQINISIPSKTFLVGEYLALAGGTSLVINTEPRFELIVTEKAGDGLCEGIAANSPAGLWLRENNHFFSGLAMKFVDPHAGQGGFGASTAQFLAVYVLSQLRQVPILSWSNEFLRDMWQQYRQGQADGENDLLPSGADLVGQALGQISLFSSNKFHKEKLSWTFSDYDFLLVRTGEKLPTHNHLKEDAVKQLLATSWTSQLEMEVRQVVQGLRLGHWAAFEKGVGQFCEHLVKKKLVAPKTHEILTKLQSNSRLLLSKGCGALGADVIFLSFKKIHGASVLESVDSLGLNVVANSKQLSTGVKVSWEELDDTGFKHWPLYNKDGVSDIGKMTV